VVHATALVTILGWVVAGASWHDAIVTGVAMLIITCPCALGLAIPTVQTVAAGARQGLRPDAQAVIAALKARNIGIEILSGDRR
jgi:cation transport ATPase